MGKIFSNNNPLESSNERYVTYYEFGGKIDFRPIIGDSFGTDGIGGGDLVVATSLPAPAVRPARDWLARKDRRGGAGVSSAG